MGLADITTALGERLSSTTAPPRPLSDAEAFLPFRWSRLRLQVIALMAVVAVIGFSNLSHLRFLRTTAHLRLEVIALMTAVAVISVSNLSHLRFLRATVYNVADRSAFQAAVMPGFIEQNPKAESLITFRSHTDSLINPEDDDITRIVELLHWVRKQENDEQFHGPPKRPADDTEDPETYLQGQKSGIYSACRRFAYIFTGALLSQGFKARVVSLVWNLDWHIPLTHNVVEVWVSSLGKWVVADPTFDAFVLVNGKPASALELHDAAEPDSASKISFDQHGATFRLPPLNTYRKYFKHIFVSRTNALFDGYRFGFFARKKITFAHYVAPGLPLFPETQKQLMFCALFMSAVVILYLLPVLMPAVVTLFWSGRLIRRYLSLCRVLAAASQEGSAERASLSAELPAGATARTAAGGSVTPDPRRPQSSEPPTQSHLPNGIYQHIGAD